MLVRILVIFSARTDTDGLPGAVLSHELLEGIAGPNVEERDRRHDGEPVGRVVDVARSVVTMKGEHAADADAPLEGLVSCVKAEERFKL